VTGGAGFIGSNLVDYFNKHFPDQRVVVFDDFSSGSEANLSNSSCELVVGSILDFPKLLSVSKQAKSVIHLAARGSVPRSVAMPRATHDVNSLGTLNVLEAARESKVDHIIVASSSSVYGSNPSLPRSEFDWTRPLSPYAASKLATEAYALAYGSSYGMNTLAMRFFNVYGPRQNADHAYAAVIPKFISAAISNIPVTIHGDGSQSRDFTYVESVCSALASASIGGVSYPQPVNTAFGTKTTITQLVGYISEGLDCQIQCEYLDPRVGDVKESQAASELFESLLPDVHRVGLLEGLDRTIQWFRDQERDSSIV